MLGTRDYPLECAALIRDLDFVEFNAFDNRRVEVIAHGLTLWQGAQLAIDTTLVSPLRGAALQTARRKKETTYPELVLGAEEEPGWSFWPQRWEAGGPTRPSQLLRGLAKARAEIVPMILQGRAKAAWLRRWSSLLACSMVRTFSESLVERRPVPCTGNVPSAHEMIREDRF